MWGSWAAVLTANDLVADLVLRHILVRSFVNPRLSCISRFLIQANRAEPFDQISRSRSHIIPALTRISLDSRGLWRSTLNSLALQFIGRAPEGGGTWVSAHIAGIYGHDAITTSCI